MHKNILWPKVVEKSRGDMFQKFYFNFFPQHDNERERESFEKRKKVFTYL